MIQWSFFVVVIIRSINRQIIKKKIEVMIQPCRKYFLREIGNVIFSEEHLRSKVWLENNKWHYCLLRLFVDLCCSLDLLNSLLLLHCGLVQPLQMYLGVWWYACDPDPPPKTDWNQSLWGENLSLYRNKFPGESQSHWSLRTDSITIWFTGKEVFFSQETFLHLCCWSSLCASNVASLLPSSFIEI